MKETWNELAFRYTADAELVNSTWTEIESAYTASNRHYHNLRHLEYMKDKACEHNHRLRDPDLILFSIFYHDIIYRVTRKDNEEKSAQLAGERLSKLGLAADKIKRCQLQIITTKTHEISIDPDTNYLLDFDLAILGDTEENYQNYARQIRAEYSLYPDILYNRGRQKVLRYFLDMNRIFKTEVFRELYEDRARQNLKSELLGL